MIKYFKISFTSSITLFISNNNDINEGIKEWNEFKEKETGRDLKRLTEKNMYV